MKKYIVGNWKMNMLPNEAAAYMEKLNILAKPLKMAKDSRKLVLCVPTLDYYIVNLTRDEHIYVGLQNMYGKDRGAYTGEISYEMSKSVGAEHVIIGHSERREIFKETDKDINEKVLAGINNSINIILCVGENENTYEKGETEKFVSSQIEKALEGIDSEKLAEENLIIAYEPIWAIGTGKTCDAEVANRICGMVKDKILEITGKEVPVLYGGSANEKNSDELLRKENIDGLLIGGASLDPEKFVKIAYSGYNMLKD